MILYCDTSALMKLYAQEAHSNDIRDAVGSARSTLVSLLAWAEVHAAFSLKQRTQQVTAKQVTMGLERLGKEWNSFTRVGVDAPLMADAGRLALQFGLRAYDSVQLASAWRVHQQIGDALTFACFDKTLNAAASELGIPLMV